MPVVLRVRVQAISSDRLSLTLPSGEQILLPRTPNDKMDHLAPGAELVITVTQSSDLINELLVSSDEK
jgi:hypothetical protein